MRGISSSTRRRRKPLMSWASKNCPPSRACRRNTPSCYRRKRRRMPNTCVRAMRCASCCSTSRTWTGCWARMSAARKRNRSMIASNGHAPKAFRRNAQPRILRVQRGLRGAAPDKQRGVFAAAKIPRKCKRGPSLPCLPRFLPSFAAMLLVLPCIGNFSLNTSPDALCFFGYSYIMYRVEYYPCGGAV